MVGIGDNKRSANEPPTSPCSALLGGNKAEVRLGRFVSGTCAHVCQVLSCNEQSWVSKNIFLKM